VAGADARPLIEDHRHTRDVVVRQRALHVADREPQQELVTLEQALGAH